MTVRLSPHKVSGIIRDYLRGVGQSAIARRYGIDQSTISIYASRFKQLADKKGILSAGKEFGVFKEVDSLRSLSVEMAKYNLTVEDALDGVGIIKLFSEIGVPPGKHADLIRLCQKIADPTFIETSLELIQVEREAGMGYDEMVSQSRSISQELNSTRAELKKIRSELHSTSNLLDNKKKEVNEEEAKLAGIRRDVESEQKESRGRLTEIRTGFKIKEKELAELADLKARLANSGVPIVTLIKLAKEFTHE